MGSLRDVGVIIVAAGSGLRADSGEAVPKQFRWVGNKPMLLHSLQAFQAHPDVAIVVCVLPRNIAGDPPPWLFQCDIERLLVTTGGETRVDSVRNGLEDLPPDLPLVLVHDAARPFIPGDMIERVIQGARTGAATVPCIPVVDTLKRVDSRGMVTGTVERTSLLRAQTPQGFPRDVLIAAHRQALREKSIATDDAALCELIGAPVMAVEGSELAMKITVPSDFLAAASLAAQLMGEEGAT